MIKVIFFDIGGVYIGGTARKVAVRLASKLGINIELARAVIGKHSKKSHIGKMNKRKYLEEVANGLGTDPKTIERLISFQGFFRIRKSTMRLVNRLNQNGYLVAAITDTDSIWLAIHRRRGTYKAFDFVLNSIDERTTKHYKTIFRRALKRAECKPSESVMIDDGAHKLSVARSIGMKTILFKTPAQATRDLRSLGVRV